jgi:hypothetical protein
LPRWTWVRKWSIVLNFELVSKVAFGGPVFSVLEKCGCSLEIASLHMGDHSCTCLIAVLIIPGSEVCFITGWVGESIANSGIDVTTRNWDTLVMDSEELLFLLDPEVIYHFWWVSRWCEVVVYRLNREDMGSNFLAGRG